MPKRKSDAPVDSDPVQTRRSTRLRVGTTSEAPVSESTTTKKPSRSTKTSQERPKPKPKSPVANKSSEDVKKATKGHSKSSTKTEAADDSNEKTYWLLKAEPETRLENGVDVRFSIDDLATKTEPEPWDGIRNYAARNNLRAMKQGDLAFFYHSNTKEPGIVGTMEIIQEHSPDLSAHDPKAPYYDASSKPSDPKWSVVHVRFRSKFATPITLKQLREMGGAGKPLEYMQMLKLTRMSVSKVSAAEWEYLMDIAEELPA